MKYDLAIIGAGPGGYVSAIRAGQLGMKTIIIDKQYVGGMCLNWGCIPTKALLESAKLYNRILTAEDFGITGIDPKLLKYDWPKAKTRAQSVVTKLTKGIEYLWKKNNVEFLKGEAKLLSEHEIEVDNRVIQADNIIISTGSKPRKLEGIAPELIIELERMFDLDALPKKPLIIGMGPVALETVEFYRLLGIPATLLVPGDNLLPGLDPYVTNYVNKKLKKAKMPVIYSKDFVIEGKICKVGDKEIAFDKIVNANWRTAILPEMKPMPELDNGFIKVNNVYQSNIPNIYAVGDVNGESYLAHAASAQGLVVINHLKGVEPEAEKKIPINIYAVPEIAQIGLTEPELVEQGIDFKISEFSLSVNGKALAEGNAEGFVRILSEKKYGEVLGVQIVASDATDMISEAGALMQMEGTVYELANTVHAHPTVSEALMEAGFDGLGEPIHKG
jgi:dihydrolipoamide dehydrogenase